MIECPKCGGEGWIWGYEIVNGSEDTWNDSMTRYTCDLCDGAGEVCDDYLDDYLDIW